MDLWGLFYLYRLSHPCIISGEVSTRGAQRPAEHSLIPSLVCAATPQGTVWVRHLAGSLELVVQRSEFTCTYSCCFGDWHSWLQEVDSRNPQYCTALVTECWTLSNDGLIGGSWPAVSSPKLTRLPLVFVMVTVMSWVPLLMRTSSLWMMGLIGHLCTAMRIPLFVGWNCQIPSVLP